MKNKISLFLIMIAAILLFNACTTPTRKEVLEMTYESRRKAVYTQVDNLIDDIGDTYVDKKALMKDLTIFIKKNPRIKKITIASLPLPLHPLSVNLTEIYRAAPAPIGKFIDKKRFDIADNMIWYRKMLRERVAFWYYTHTPTQKAATISYICPSLRRTDPAVMLFVIKIDFDKDDNPVLFWNVPKKLYKEKLLEEEGKYVDKYLKLKKELEDKILTAQSKEKREEAKEYYNLKLQVLKETDENRRKALKELQRRERK